MVVVKSVRRVKYDIRIYMNYYDIKPEEKPWLIHVPAAAVIHEW